MFNDSHFIRAYGYFSFHTYKEPKYESELLLKLDRNQTSKNTFVWVFDYSHNRSRGWAKQTSRIKLTLKGSYNPEQEMTTFVLTSYIYARTAGSVHSASTLSRIDRIQFSQGHV